MKQLLPLLLSALVITSCIQSPDISTKRVERRNWKILDKLDEVHGDVRSITIIDHTIDSSSGKRTESRKSVFKFNKHGDVVEISDNEGKLTRYQYEYDSNGFPIAEVEQRLGYDGEIEKITTIYINKINYQGLLEEWSKENNGDFEHFTYDEEGNLTSMRYYYEGITSEYVGDCEYKYNKDGQIIAINDEIDRFTKTYSTHNYNSKGELTTIHYVEKTWRGEEIETYTSVCKHDPKSGLVEVISKDGKNTYKYDRHGNLIETARYNNIYDKYPSSITKYKISYRLFGLF